MALQVLGWDRGGLWAGRRVYVGGGSASRVRGPAVCEAFRFLTSLESSRRNIWSWRRPNSACRQRTCGRCVRRWTLKEGRVGRACPCHAQTKPLASRVCSGRKRPGPASRSRVESCRCDPSVLTAILFRMPCGLNLFFLLPDSRLSSSFALDPCCQPSGAAGEGDGGSSCAGGYARWWLGTVRAGTWRASEGARPGLVAHLRTCPAGGTHSLVGCRTARAHSWRRWPGLTA